MNSPIASSSAATPSRHSRRWLLAGVGGAAALAGAGLAWWRFQPHAV
ncbi:MAG: TlpA family protein disulfide reductase, partial [Comamonadaceae bacterium]